MIQTRLLILTAVLAGALLVPLASLAIAGDATDCGDPT